MLAGLTLAILPMWLILSRAFIADCELHCSLQKFLNRGYQKIGGEIDDCEHGRELGDGLK
jgi:hypothetical protein